MVTRTCLSITFIRTLSVLLKYYWITVQYRVLWRMVDFSLTCFDLLESSSGRSLRIEAPNRLHQRKDKKPLKLIRRPTISESLQLFEARQHDQSMINYCLDGSWFAFPQRQEIFLFSITPTSALSSTHCFELGGFPLLSDRQSFWKKNICLMTGYSLPARLRPVITPGFTKKTLHSRFSNTTNVESVFVFSSIASLNLKSQ